MKYDDLLLLFLQQNKICAKLWFDEEHEIFIATRVIQIMEECISRKGLKQSVIDWIQNNLEHIDIKEGK